MQHAREKTGKPALDGDALRKLAAIDNEALHAFVTDAVELCQPDSVWISTDSADDLAKTRRMAMQMREETALQIPGHTIHFDGMEDQGRDREVTKYLVPNGDTLSPALNQMERDKGLSEGWLAEHMFLSGVHGKGGRKTYLAGAFPSACGKTSTAMLPGETILGDDIAYFHAVDGKCRAANAEAGIFGIIQDVSAKGDPAIWDVLTKSGEVIFSNVLVKDGRPYWLGMGEDPPVDGENFSGAWYRGKKDAKGVEIPCAHKNARYAVSLKALNNCDPELDNPAGVELAGIMYGGRDAKAYVPVQQGFDWEHGIVAYGASLETETTFATIGKEGVPEINLMSIQDFVAIPLGKYIRNNLEFGRKLKKPPLVFGVNYFLRDHDGKFVNGVRDKHVWVKWMEIRVHGEANALRTPTGMIPCHEDLRRLFNEVLGKDYPLEDYIRQFTIRVRENLAKLDRVEKFHRDNVGDAPPEVFTVLAAQRERLLDAQRRFGNLISPECFIPMETRR